MKNPIVPTPPDATTFLQFGYHNLQLSDSVSVYAIGAQITAPIRFYASSVYISGGNISGNLSNMASGIMKIDTSVTFTGTASGPRIVNNTFYAS